MADRFSGVDPDVEIAKMAEEGGLLGGTTPFKQEQMIPIPYLGIEIPAGKARDPEYIKNLIWERLGSQVSRIPEAAAEVVGGIEESVKGGLTGLGYRAVGKEPPKGPPPKPIGPETLRAGLRAPWELPPGAQAPGAQIGVGGAVSKRVSGPALGTGTLSRLLGEAGEMRAAAGLRGEERLGQIEEATEAQVGAARRIEEQRGMTLEAEAGIGMGLESDIARAVSEHNEKIKAIEAKKQGAWDKVTDVQRRMSEASVDPQRYFKDGGSLWSALAVGLGAVGQAFQRTAGDPGARNMGVDAMMRAIDNDIAAQEVEIQKLGLEATVAGNVLARYQVELGNAEDAKAAAKLGMIQQAQRMIDIVRKQGAVAMTPDVADATVAGLEMAGAKAAADLDARLLQSSTAILAQESGLARTRATLAESRAARAAAAQPAGGMYPVPGLRTFDPRRPAPSKTDISKVRQYWPRYKTVRRLLADLIEYRRKEGAGISVGPEYARAAQTAHKLILVLKKHEEMGAHFTPMEEELLLISRDPKKFGYLLDGYEKRLNIIDNESLDWLQYGMNATPEVVTGR